MFMGLSKQYTAALTVTVPPGLLIELTVHVLVEVSPLLANNLGAESSKTSLPAANPTDRALWSTGC
jgi:hypothetical protein